MYGTFYLLFWVVVFGFIYVVFLKPKPTCFDKVLNQDEVEIDCGGVCTNVCIPFHALPIESVGQVTVLYPDEGHMSILARIRNPNTDYLVKSFLYTFILRDKQNTVVQTLEARSFIYPGETKYVLLPNIERVSFAGIEFKTDKVQWILAEGEPGPANVSAQGAEMRVKNGMLVVEGNVSNNDIALVPETTVIATFTGSLGQIAGASQTEISNLAPGEKRAFSIIHPDIPTVDLSATKIFVYPRRP